MFYRIWRPFVPVLLVLLSLLPMSCSEPCSALNTDGDTDGDQADGDVSPDDGDAPDGDTEPDGDTVINCKVQASPFALDFGAVLRDDTPCLELSLSNDCPELIQLNSSLIVQYGVADTEMEFGLAGSYPSENNLIDLARGDSHDFQVCYSPSNPGKDSGRLIVGTSNGLLEISLNSQVKGFPMIEASCEDLDPDFVSPDEEWDEACACGLIQLGEMVSMEITLKNNPSDEYTNAELVIDKIELFDPDDPDSVYNDNYEIDYNTITYNENTTEIWISPGKEEVFTLHYVPHSRQLHKLHMKIHHNDPEQESPLILKILCAGVVPELDVQPGVIDFGFVPKGQCETIPVHLANIGAADLCIESANLREHSEILDRVFLLNLDPGATGQDSIPVCLAAGSGEESSTSIDLTCCPVDRVAYSNVLEIISDHFGVERYLEPVSVTCTGISANCDIYPRQINFGNIRVGREEMRVVTIFNGGGAPAHIESVSLRGSYNFEIDQIPEDFTIPAASYYEIFVRYRATVTGGESALLTIVPREGDCPKTEIPITGGGMQPLLDTPDDCIVWEHAQVPPEDLSPEELEQWQDRREISISNLGNDSLTIYEAFIPQEYEDLFSIHFDELPVPIYPGQHRVFSVGYAPKSYGEHNGVAVLCTDAQVSGDSEHPCSAPEANAQEICLVGSAIDPRMFVEPTSGKHIWTGITVGSGPSDPKTVRVTSQGNGPVSISDISLQDIDDDSISLISMTYESADILDNFPAAGIELENGEAIEIVAQCEPTEAGRHDRILYITHNDMDMIKPGGDIGVEYPQYKFYLTCTSEDNLAPKAIVKSPAGVPPGPFGSRYRTVSKGECINLDGSSSYDDNQDSIVYYKWTATPGVSLNVPAEGENLQITQACFNQNGSYTVTLEVQDANLAWSDTSLLDAKLEVTVQEAPTAIAYECNTFLTYLSPETGIEVCFDGSNSTDDDGTIESYAWYVQKLGGEKINFSTSPMSAYTFDDPGTYEVSLVVTDNDGNPSEADIIDVEAYSDESLRVELTWTGRGDVDLHYLRPEGIAYDLSDCYVGNPAPNWQPQGYGHPQHVQGSLDGISPEIIVHNDPGDGSYEIMAIYEAAEQDCYFVTDRVWYEENCDMCDCDCKPFCLVARICCQSCWVDTQEWVCDDIPAMLNYKLFVNDSLYSTCERSGPSVKVNEQGDRHSFQMSRTNGKWLCF